MRDRPPYSRISRIILQNHRKIRNMKKNTGCPIILALHNAIIRLTNKEYGTPCSYKCHANNCCPVKFIIFLEREVEAFGFL